MRRLLDRPLGVLTLENTPTNFPGSLVHPETFEFPVLWRPVPGAWVSNVVPGDPAVEPAYVSTAQALVADGAVAITTNCGFAIRYQKTLAKALRVPVATSSLLLLPMLAAVVQGRIGILTFDARPLTQDVLRLAGLPADAQIAVAGLEGTKTWDIMSMPNAPITLEQMRGDLIERIERLRRDHPDITTLLFECAGFAPLSADVRKLTGLPAYDVVTSAELLMSGIIG